MSAPDTKPLVDRDSLLREICALLADYNPKDVEVTENTDMSADLSIDSVAAMNLIMEVEDKFDVSIPINLLSDVRTVGDLVAVVEQIIGRK